MGICRRRFLFAFLFARIEAVSRRLKSICKQEPNRLRRLLNPGIHQGAFLRRERAQHVTHERLQPM